MDETCSFTILSSQDDTGEVGVRDRLVTDDPKSSRRGRSTKLPLVWAPRSVIWMTAARCFTSMSLDGKSRLLSRYPRTADSPNSASRRLSQTSS